MAFTVSIIGFLRLNALQRALGALGGSNYVFKLRNANSGLVADVSGFSTADGAELIQYSDNGGANQRWLLIDRGNGRYVIKSKLSGKLVDVEGATLNSGANLVQMTEGGGNSQKWALEPTN